MPDAPNHNQSHVMETAALMQTARWNFHIPLIGSFSKFWAVLVAREFVNLSPMDAQPRRDSGTAVEVIFFEGNQPHYILHTMSEGVTRLMCLYSYFLGFGSYSIALSAWQLGMVLGDSQG